MKKQILLSLIAATILCGGASAQTLSVADVEALPGETVAYTLKIDVEGGDYKGFQYQMTFPATGFATAGTTVANADWDGASFSVGDLDAAGQANASAYSSSDTSIPDGERVIGTVKFMVAESVATGDYDVTISDFNFLDGTNYVPVADVTFKVKVVERHIVVLDENATVAPAEATGVDVRVLRTIGAGVWSTICLPFAMSEAQTKEAFGDDVQIADFTGCEATYDDAEENIIALKVNFEDVAEMEANHPYIIKVGSDVTEFSVEGVDITPSDELSVDRDEDRYKRNGKWYYDYNSFIGTYEAGTEIPENSLFLSGNKFWYSAGKTTTKAFRGYFAFYMVLSDITAAEARISLWIDGGATTGISNIEHSTLNIEHSVYDLQGRRMESSVSNSQCSILKKGLYVKDGKKIIIK